MTHFKSWPFSELDLFQQIQIEHHSPQFSDLRYFLKPDNITLLKFHYFEFSNQALSGIAFKCLIWKKGGA